MTEVKRDEAPLKNSLHRGIITGDGAAGGEGGTEGGERRKEGRFRHYPRAKQPSGTLKPGRIRGIPPPADSCYLGWLSRVGYADACGLNNYGCYSTFLLVTIEYLWNLIVIYVYILDDYLQLHKESAADVL